MRPGSSLSTSALRRRSITGATRSRSSAEVLVVDRTAALVELVEFAVEAEQRAEQLRIEVLDDGIELVDAVLERRAGQHEGMRSAQLLDAPRRLGLPVLDALRLVEDDDVGRQHRVDVLGRRTSTCS